MPWYAMVNPPHRPVPQIVWVWVLNLATELTDEGREPNPVRCVPMKSTTQRVRNEVADIADRTASTVACDPAG